MKTFESELAELVAWVKRKNEDYDMAPDSDGRDGDANYEFLQAIQEYNKRLQELKSKYGK